MKILFHRVSIAVAVSWIAVTATFGARPEVTVPNHMPRFMLSMPLPEYPLEARVRNITGRGTYEVEFHPKTGIATHVKIFKSSGSKFLDEAARGALSRWRVRPGRFTRIRIPITFTLAK